jgi:ABC-type bacteriocin/lantibiotic exporter with double-glycine peptidase domain
MDAEPLKERFQSILALAIVIAAIAATVWIIVLYDGLVRWTVLAWLVLNVITWVLIGRVLKNRAAKSDAKERAQAMGHK